MANNQNLSDWYSTDEMQKLVDAARRNRLLDGPGTAEFLTQQFNIAFRKGHQLGWGAADLAGNGFARLYDYIGRMKRDNVAHKTKGFRLGEMTLDDQLTHLADEAIEVAHAAPGIDRQMEICDLLGIVIHMAIDAGMTPDHLCGGELGKLQVRFEHPKPV